MKLMMVGDTHGEARAITDKIDYAKKIGNIQRLVVLGDFGLWWGYDGVKFLDEINAYAKANNVQIFAIPGNHENHEWWDAIIEHAPKSHGWAYARTHVLLSPKVHAFRWGGKQFVVAGGAYSIDKEWRIQRERGWDIYEKRKCVPLDFPLWSPGEQLTDEQVEEFRKIGNEVKTDYLLTHDCSDKTPFRGRFKPDLESKIHRQRIDKVLKYINPKYHFHGHMHTVYDWMNFVGEKDGEAVYVQTYGLECNNDYWSWGVLDLETDTFEWPDTLLGHNEDEDFIRSKVALNKSY